MAPKTRNSTLSNKSTHANASTAQTNTSRKRNTSEAELPETRQRDKQAKTTDAPDVTHNSDDNDDDENKDENKERKPRLTTPDLEFDYDRSQLRDQRPTPGRVKRPRWEGRELSEEFKQRFYIPPSPEKPKGRSLGGRELWMKEIARKKKVLSDPTETFHDLHVCHKKGREGSPTYDAAGFQLDWKIVDDWMRPKTYNKRSIVNGVGRRQEKREREERQIYDIFFVDGKAPEKHLDVMAHLKDQVSKDLGVPWHQIGPDHLVEWEKKGFEKKKFEDWWREPNAVEKDRMSRMQSGASLRKDL